MRVALFTIGTAGDIVPFARAARALVARGHTVTVSTWAHYASWFDGVRFAPAPGPTPADVDAAFDAAFREADMQQQRWHYCRLFYARAQDAVASARAVLGEHDVALINTLDHAAQTAATDIPWASYTSRPPPHRALADEVNADVDAALRELFGRRVRTFREESPYIGFAACSSHLVGDTDPRVMLTGAWLDPPTAAALPPSVEEHLARGPTLFATFGTMPDVRGRSAVLIEAAKRSGWRAIVQVLLPPFPDGADDILVLRERVDFAAILPRVAAVVHHGSVGTTHEVLRAAKPALVIPHMGDQFFWGLTLHQRGLGPEPVRFDAVDAATVAQRMELLRHDRYALRLATIGAAIGAENGVAVAVAGLEVLGR